MNIQKNFPAGCQSAMWRVKKSDTLCRIISNSISTSSDKFSWHPVILRLRFATRRMTMSIIVVVLKKKSNNPALRRRSKKIPLGKAKR